MRNSETMRNPPDTNRVSDPVVGTFWKSRVLLDAIERQKSPSWLNLLKFKKGEEISDASASALCLLLTEGQSKISAEFKELKLTGALEKPLPGTFEGT